MAVYTKSYIQVLEKISERILSDPEHTKQMCWGATQRCFQQCGHDGRSRQPTRALAFRPSSRCFSGPEGEGQSRTRQNRRQILFATNHKVVSVGHGLKEHSPVRGGGRSFSERFYYWKLYYYGITSLKMLFQWAASTTKFLKKLYNC